MFKKQLCQISSELVAGITRISVETIIAFLIIGQRAFPAQARNSGFLAITNCLAVVTISIKTRRAAFRSLPCIYRDDTWSACSMVAEGNAITFGGKEARWARFIDEKHRDKRLSKTIVSIKLIGLGLNLSQEQTC